jgi:hypothetical protein
VFFTVQFAVLVFLVFQFSRNCRFSRTKMADMLSMNNHRILRNGPVDPFMKQCIVTDCQKCTKSLGRYLNVNYSTPVLTSNSITMSNWHGVSSEKLVDMRAP